MLTRRTLLKSAAPAARAPQLCAPCGATFRTELTLGMTIVLVAAVLVAQVPGRA